MAVKLVAVHLPDTMSSEEKDRALLDYERRLNDFGAFSEDRGWQCNASMFNIGTTVVAAYQLFHTPQHQVKEETLSRELAKWEEEKKVLAARGTDGTGGRILKG